MLSQRWFVRALAYFPAPLVIGAALLLAVPIDPATTLTVTGRPVEVVAARVRAEAPGAPVSLPELPRGSGDPKRARVERRPVWFGRPRPTWVYDRTLLRARDRVGGPAIVLQLDTTTVIPPGWWGAVDKVGNLVLEGS